MMFYQHALFREGGLKTPGIWSKAKPLSKDLLLFSRARVGVRAE
jgi:hypothetical protein